MPAIRLQPVTRGPGQESVWDYPRPPVLEPVPERLRVELGGATVAATVRGWRVLETSHPPTYYLPPEDILDGTLVAVGGRSWCEWKGQARYFDVVGGSRLAIRAAWTYPKPTPAFEAIRGHVAFHAGLVDACWVGEEGAVPQEGGFHGGWITSRIVGPFIPAYGNSDLSR